MRILIIEDDKHLVWSIKSKLEKNGYPVDFETDGLAGQERAVSFLYDLIILDIMLPKADGFSVCEYIRRNGIDTPILMLTARDYIGDKVHGLDCGADDYLPKPFSYPELYARIRALIRRANGHPGVEIIIKDLCINTSKKTVGYAGNNITLTYKEYAILEYLAINKNGIVTQEMLEEHVWGSDNHIFSNVLEVFVSRIRKKLNPDDREAVIKTVNGLGYVIKDEKP
ncbi:MAG: response regulator transcription factor [Dehalococcoidales bacterium]|nr:response regulator transcription factor [Dehalococcoidales bacterium]